MSRQSPKPTITIKQTKAGIINDIVSAYGQARFRVGMRYDQDRHTARVLHSILFSIGMSNTDGAALTEWGDECEANGRAAQDAAVKS